MRYYNRKCEPREWATDKRDMLIQEFKREYEDYYYLDSEGQRRIPTLPGSSRTIEERIEALFQQETLGKNDIDLILAWKIGGIDHVKSEFTTEWKTNENGNVKARYFNCEKSNYDRFCERLSKNASSIANTYFKTGTEEALKEILSIIQGANESETVIGLGPVYILTILYFITKGESPIFDRYAYTAVKAIYNGVKPDEIWYENPSSDNSWHKEKNEKKCEIMKEKAAKAIAKVINEYSWYLKQVFGTKNIPRYVDRSLWVYGHPDTLIKISET